MDLPSVTRPEPRAAQLPAQALIGKQNSAAHNASPQAQQKANPNSAVAHSAGSVVLQSGDEPQVLLLRSVIASINEQLEPTLGTDAIEFVPLEDDGPEAVAERLVTLSTGLYEAFRQGDVEADASQVLQEFMDILRRGFELGFTEAQDILQGLGVGDEASEELQQIRELALAGMTAFEETFATDSTAGLVTT